jgi:hypothetical protein
LTPLIADDVGGYKWLPGFKIILWLNLLTIFFQALDVAIFTLLDAKIASQVIYLGHFFLAICALIVLKLLPVADNPETLLQILDGAGFHYWGGIAVIAASYLIVSFSGRVFEMREWADLEET